MSDLDAFARIHVSDHSIERARERVGWDDSDERIRSRIRIEVRAALLVNRVANVRPNWSRGPYADELDPREGYHFVWDGDITHCWVLNEVEGGRSLRVATVFASSELQEEHTERRNIRKGMRRT